MMSEISLEGLDRDLGYNESAVDVPQVPTPSSQETFPTVPVQSGPSLSQRFSSSLCCPFGCDTSSNSTPLHQVQPVILKPNNDVYLELKPHRRLRVIHIPSGGIGNTDRKLKGVTSSRDGSSFGDNNPDPDESSDEDEYWFENADPDRPKIEAQGIKVIPPGQQRRIFHKLAPQERPTLQDLGSKSEKNFISPARLPRKKFVQSKEEKEDSKSPHSTSPRSETPPKRNVSLANDEIEFIPSEGSKEMAKSVFKDVPDLISNLGELGNQTLEEFVESALDGGRKSPKHFDAESPENTLRRVVTIPDPGESSTDEVSKPVVISGTVVVTGSFLGGVANIGFEADDDVHAVDSVIDSADVGYKRTRSLPELQESESPLETTAVSLDETKGNSSEIPTDEVQREDPEKMIDRKPLLFFVHGVGGSADSWQNQLSFFSCLGYEVIAPDLLGHGFSSTPDRVKAYTFTKLFRDILTVFDHFCVAGGRQNPCVVVGHSYGSSIATALARSRPDHVKVLVLIASGGPTALSPPSCLTPQPLSILTWIMKPFLKCGFLQRKKAKAKGKSTGITDGYDVPAYVIKHTLMGQVWPEGDVTFHRRITVPTLLVYGLKDGFVSLVEMCEMERTLPKAYLELIPMAGHHIMIDNPKELNAMIKKFVEKYQPSGIKQKTNESS